MPKSTHGRLVEAAPTPKRPHVAARPPRPFDIVAFNAALAVLG